MLRVTTPVVTMSGAIVGVVEVVGMGVRPTG